MIQLRKNIILLAVALQLVAPNSTAVHIEGLESLQVHNSANNEDLITAPYYVLSNATFTNDLTMYQYNDFTLKIIDKSNPEVMKLQATRNANKVDNYQKQKIGKLPWWSKAAPKILKTLDFTQVNGDRDTYKLSDSYRLVLLANQGHWGKVYVLEYLDKMQVAHKICALKLLLTKSNDNMSINEFRNRHQEEIKNIITIANWNVAIVPYGIIKNDQDHYLVFLEYGQNTKERFTKQPLEVTLQQLDALMLEVEKMHALGYAHGDLKIDNMLFVGDVLKLCDWFSLINYTQITVGEYRYIGDNLPPEAIRAFYFDKIKKDSKNLKYALIEQQQQSMSYWLHPIAADRFCLAVSLLEILAPDLYEVISKQPFPKGFNLYQPDSLEFWSEYVKVIHQVQRELSHRAKMINNPEDIHYKTLHKIIGYIDLDPLNR